MAATSAVSIAAICAVVIATNWLVVKLLTCVVPMPATCAVVKVEMLAVVIAARSEVSIAAICVVVIATNCLVVKDAT